jgi:alkylation response protein AidB-like acyl-CoA dehydrogenase
MSGPTSAELETYRESLRGWLEQNIPAWWREEVAATGFEAEENFPELRVWHRQLFEAGYLGVTWPKEYGGQGLSIQHEIVRSEELQRASAPPTVNLLGITLCAPALLGYATEEQKRRHLRNMLSAAESWGPGYTEPGSGADLAGRQTRAVVDGDDYVVNGPGIEVAPLQQMTGGTDFCQVFFTDVRAPRADMVGEPTQGWQIANHVLMHERAADISCLRYENFLHAIAERAKNTRKGGAPLAEDPVFRQRFAQLSIEFEVLRQNTLKALELQKAGATPGSESSLFKLQASEFEQRLTKFATDAQGPWGQLWQESPGAVDQGIWQFREMWARAYTIYAGTSEIQRNIISERVLGLPRA